MAFDTATISSVLKTVYEPGLRDQQNNGTVLLAQLKKHKRRYVGGKEAYFALRKGRNVGIGARPEDIGSAASAALPEPGNQQYDKALYDIRRLYGSIKITGPAMAMTKSEQGSYVRGLQSEMEGLGRDLAVDQNRQAWHDGSSVLTQCKVTAASTSVEVESTKFLQAGMEIDVVQLADGAVDAGAQGRTVVSVTDTDTFVISGAAITTSAVDGVFRKNSRIMGTPPSAADWGKSIEVWGLEAIVNSVNPGNGLLDKVGGIDRAAADTGFWKANRLTNGGVDRPLDLDLMQQAMDETDIASDFLPGLILTSYAGKRKYGNFLTPDKRYPAGGEITLDGGYKALEFNGTPIVADRDASQTNKPQLFGKMYFLTMSSFWHYVNKDWQWMDEDGAILSRVSRRDSYEATFHSYQNVICLHMNRNTVIEDLTGV